MKHPITTCIAGLLCCCLVSCGGLTPGQIREIKKTPAPQAKGNKYSDALDKFGAMLIAYENPSSTFYLLGKTVTNKTACGSLPMDISQMVATAVNRLGGKVRYIPYDPNYLINEANLSFPVNRAVPALVIDGAITECDENLENDSSGVNADILASHRGHEGSASGGVDRGSSLTRIALDFHLMDYRTSALLPRIQSSFGADIKTLKGGFSFGLEALGSSIGFNSSRQFTQGKHDAVRTLVDVSILQLLGKYLGVPYWRCLDGAAPDPVVISKLKNSFILAPEQKRLATVQFLLRQFGYSMVTANGAMDQATQAAIEEVAAKSGGKVRAEVSPDLYAWLYVNRPLSLDPEFQSGMAAQELALKRQQLIARKQRMAQQRARMQGDKATAGVSPRQSTARRQGVAKKRTSSRKPAARKQQQIHFAPGLETAIIYRPGETGEFVLMSGGKLSSGTKYKIVVQPERRSYLYVFQKDSTGRLYLIFPDTTRTDGLKNPLPGKVKQEFPGEGQYFSLDENRGSEMIYFYPSRKRDKVLEQAIAEMNADQIGEDQKIRVEREIFQYLASKDVVAETEEGDSFKYHGVNGIEVGRLNKIPHLDTGKLYIFSFKHD